MKFKNSALLIVCAVVMTLNVSVIMISIETNMPLSGGDESIEKSQEILDTIGLRSNNDEEKVNVNEAEVKNRKENQLPSLESVTKDVLIDDEKEDQATPVPIFYHNWTLADIEWYFECDYDDRPMIPNIIWRKTRELYITQYSSTPELNPKDDGFAVPVKARKSPGKGRGIFAKRDIKKGELVWNPTHTATFNTAEVFRDFIFALDKNYTCDYLNFCYVQNVGMYGNNTDLNMDTDDINTQEDSSTVMIINVDLDEGGLCNGGNANLGCRDGMADGYEGGCEMNYFALRDIPAGDEIICDYTAFQAKAGSWKYFGL